MARFADGEAWPVRRTGDKTAGSAPAQSSINNSAAAISDSRVLCRLHGPGTQTS